MAMKKKERLADFEIDKLTNSIEVFKLSTVNNPSVIQGLISIEEKPHRG
jgi:hypothetical protein